MRLGCIADDLTGATDLANELARNGLSVVQTVGLRHQNDLPDVEAVVVGLKTRSVPAQDAVDQSLAALEWLRTQGCERFYFKYCSTFDSTPAGNIGPVIEALAQALCVEGIIACPAFPANGRTVYKGHLFVGDRLLNESGMEGHPITPMTDANLVRVLQAQMTGKVGLLGRASGTGDWPVLPPGLAAVIADAVDDDDLTRLGAYCAKVPLSSGGSGLGAGVARALAGPAASPATATLPGNAARRAVIAGSCSEATRRQVAAFTSRWPSYRVTLRSGEDAESAIAAATRWIDAQKGDNPLLVYSTAAPDQVARQREARPGEDASALIEEVLAQIAAHLAGRGVDAMIVAGGETSGAVVQRLGLDRLLIGPEIDPGVPWTIAALSDGKPLALALKSGNFGTDDFFIKAWDMLP